MTKMKTKCVQKSPWISGCFATLFGVFYLPVTAEAQVVGRVVIENNAPLPMVQISTVQSGHTTQSGSDGRFELNLDGVSSLFHPLDAGIQGGSVERLELQIHGGTLFASVYGKSFTVNGRNITSTMGSSRQKSMPGPVLRRTLSQPDTLLFQRLGYQDLRIPVTEYQQDLGDIQLTRVHEIVYGSLTDARDGHVYPTVSIGPQIWMAENLAYLPRLHTDASFNEARYYVYGYKGTNVEEARATSSYEQYGVMYNWVAAMGGVTAPPQGRVQGICPAGWYVPSENDVRALLTYLGGNDMAGNKLKATTGWANDSMATTNEYGFSAVPGGFSLGTSTFDKATIYGFHWSSTTDSLRSTHGFLFAMMTNRPHVTPGYTPKDRGLSVRCLQNN